MSFQKSSTIGISGFTSPVQVLRAKRLFDRLNPSGSARKFRVGVEFDEDAAMGFPPNGIVPRARLADVFYDNAVENCLNFSFMADVSNLATHLSVALEYAGVNIHCVQVDADWPDPSAVLDGVYRSRKAIKTLLRIGTNALYAAGNDPVKVVKMLADYTDVICGVQFHATYDPDNTAEAMGLLPHLVAVRERYPEWELGISSIEWRKVVASLGPVTACIPDISVGTHIDPGEGSCLEEYLEGVIGFFASRPG